MNYRSKYLLWLILLLPILASAHGLVTTQSQTVGNFIVEFEYNTIGNIIASDYTLYDAYLLNSKTREGASFDSSFIRIEKQDGPAMLSGNLAQAAEIPGYASLSGTLTDPGTYTAEISFYKNGKTLAETKFNFTVEKNQTDQTADLPDQKKPFNFAVLLFLAGLVLGAGGMMLYRVYTAPKI